MTQEGAVTFDKNGNAHVDTNREAWSNKKTAGILIGIGAIAAIGAGIAHFYSTKDTGLLTESLKFRSGNTGTLSDVSDVLNTPADTFMTNDFLDNLSDSNKSTDVTKDIINHTPEQHKTFELEDGKTISHYALDALRAEGIANPTKLQILERTRETLELNNLTWPQARDLPIGFKFKV